MRSIVTALILVAGLIAGWYFASPWWAMKGLRDAAMEGDSVALEERIDFPALRESVKGQLQQSIARQPPENGGVLGRLGGVIAAEVGDRAIDMTVTPSRIGTLVTTGAMVSPLLPDRLRGQEIDWDVKRTSFDQFQAQGTFEDGTPAPRLEFVRDGLGWKLVAVDLITID